MSTAMLPGRLEDHGFTWTLTGVIIQTPIGETLVFPHDAMVQFGSDFRIFDLLDIVEPNEPPVANDDGLFEIDQDTTLALADAVLLANDHDVDGDPIEIVSVGMAVNGTVTRAGGIVVFTPNAGFIGLASYGYTITDGSDFANAIVNIQINEVVPANNPPIAVDDPGAGVYQVEQDTQFEVSAFELLQNDSDADGDNLSLESVQDPINGNVGIVGADVVFTPDPGYVGPASFEYTISDGTDLATARVSMNVFPVDNTCNPDPDGYVASIFNEPEIPSPHPDGQMTDEHNRLLALVPRDQANCVAICDGSWSDSSIWWNGRIPQNDDQVLIPHDRIVDYDIAATVSVLTLRVDGVLNFASDRDTFLTVDTMVNTSTGTLNIQTPAGFETEIAIAENGPIDVDWDPALLSRGVISHGQVMISGAEKLHRSKLVADPSAGETMIDLVEEPYGWKVGDEIVITGTLRKDLFDGEQSEDEVVQITSIDAGVIEFQPALQHDHHAPRSDLAAYVVNLDRNVVFSSESTMVSHRGHVMFMHSEDVVVENAAFIHMGRTDKSFPAGDPDHFGGIGNLNAYTNVKGRYSFHFHRAGLEYEESPIVVDGCVVRHSPGWGFVHHSSNVNYTRCVSFDVLGAGFAAEDGDEIGNWHQCTAIKSEGAGGFGSPVEKIIADLERDDMGRFGEGFFLHGRLVEVSECVAISCNHGFCWQHRGVITDPLTEHMHQPETGWGRERTQVKHTVIQGFRDNEAFGGTIGLLILKAGPHQQHDVRTVLNGFKAWEVHQGAEISYTAEYTLLDFDLLGTVNRYKTGGRGCEFGNNLFNMTVNRMKIGGFYIGFDFADKYTFSIDSSHVQINLIDMEFQNNDTDISNYDPARLRLLTSDDLNPGVLSFDWQSTDTVTMGQDFEISGTKTDSLGEVARPLGGAMHGVRDFQIPEWLRSLGYHRLLDGSPVVIFEDYVSSREDGALLKYTKILNLDVPDHKLVQWQVPFYGTLEPGAPVPDVENDAFNVDPDSYGYLDVMANDIDPDGGALVVSGVTNPQSGNAWVQEDGTILYKPNRRFRGVDQFQYWVRDTRGNLAPGIAMVNVT